MGIELDKNIKDRRVSHEAVRWESDEHGQVCRFLPKRAYVSKFHRRVGLCPSGISTIASSQRIPVYET